MNKIRVVLSVLILSIAITLSSLGFAQLQPPPDDPPLQGPLGPPLTADLTERLLEDGRQKKTDTTLSGRVQIRFPSSIIRGFFAAPVTVDGIVEGNDIILAWFHCTGSAKKDHDLGLGAGAFLSIVAQDFFLFSQDSARVRSSVGLDKSGAANSCYDVPPGHIETDVVYQALLDGKVYVDLHTTDSGADIETGALGTGEIGGILCLAKNRSDKCLP